VTYKAMKLMHANNVGHENSRHDYCELSAVLQEHLFRMCHENRCSIFEWIKSKL